MSIGKAGSQPGYDTVNQQLALQAALQDHQITFQEAQNLKKTYGSKAAMIKALTNPENPMVKDEASAKALVDMVFKADKYANKMRTAELETIAIEFVDGAVKKDDSKIVDPWDDGVIEKGELTFRTDYRDQAKMLNEDRTGWYQHVVGEGYPVQKGPDGNLYLTDKASSKFVQDVATKHGLPAGTFGSPKDLQKYAGVRADGKIGTGTVHALVYKGADVLDAELLHGMDPAKRSDQDKLAVAVAVDLAVEARGGGETGKSNLISEAKAIVARGGPKGRTEKLAVAAALELLPDPQAKLAVLGLDEATVHKAVSEASPGDRPDLVRTLKSRALLMLPPGKAAPILETIKREEGLALRADTFQRAKKDPLGHDAYKVRGYDSLGRMLNALTSKNEYQHVKGELKAQIVSELNEWGIANPYELGVENAQRLEASGIRYDSDSKKWTAKAP